MDRLFDRRLELNGSFLKLPARAAQMPRRRVLVANVDVPARRAGLEAMLTALQRTRHDVTARLAPLGERGKFENIKVAIASTPLDGFDWLIVVDDDISFREGFLDRFLFMAEAVRFRICQPAYLFHSYTSWQVTQRVWNSLAHATQFVECGPMTAFHHSVFADCLPFPETRRAWGIDLLWSEIARRGGFKIGVIDATPIEHLREVADSYDREDATAEADDLVGRFGAKRDVRKLMMTGTIFRMSDITPLIDVLISVYNAGRTVSSALDSIQTQTIPDIRIIVIDDGSTDDTAAIVADMATMDPRAELHRKENGGIVDALNFGLERCRAEFVARFDGDNLSHPGRLARQLGFLQANPDYVAVGGRVRHIDEDGQPTGSVVDVGPPELADLTWLPSLEPYIIHSYWPAVRTWMQLAATALFSMPRIPIYFGACRSEASCITCRTDLATTGCMPAA